MKKALFDPVKGNPLFVFIYYSVPSVLGMLSVSCAVIVDGFFIGRHCGSSALAAVNLCLPVSAILIGIALMLSAGASARCGRLLGENKRLKANALFTLTVIVTFLLGLFFSLTALLFLDEIIMLFGSDKAFGQVAKLYLAPMLCFGFFQMLLVCFSFFLRLEGSPLLSAGILTLGSFLNIALDFLFIVKWDQGLFGAAMGTGLSEMLTALFLAVPFFTGRTRLTFTRMVSPVSEAISSAINGISEFSNEISAGIITFTFNWIIMKQVGHTGVAAFSVVNYILLSSVIVYCGVSEAIQPLVSRNYGAMKPGRINSFLVISAISVTSVGITISALTVFLPDVLTRLFINDNDVEIIMITRTFMNHIWPVFLINGLNIIINAYLTAMSRPGPSACLAMFRNAVMPLFFLLTLPAFFGLKGLFLVLPAAEAVTLCITALIMTRNRPAQLVTP